MSKKIVLFVVEGGTDITALAAIFKELITDSKVRFELVRGDAFTKELEQNISDEEKVIKNYINKIVGDFLKQYKLRKSDILEVVHIIDTDGAYIENEKIMQKDNIGIEYREECIITKNKKEIEKRNSVKARNLNKVITVKDINGMPYSVYYFSCNREHVFHNEMNATYEEKGNYAKGFSKKYYKKELQLLEDMKNDDAFLKCSYEESW